MKKAGANSFIFFVALIAGFGGFLFGFDSSVIADVKDQVMVQLSLSEWQWSQIVSISLFGCILGIPLSGFFADKVSRRFLLKTVASGFILGTVLCAFTHDFILLLMGRFIIGICIGVASYIAPLFIAEIAPPNRRGTLVLINGLTITFGQAIAYLIGYFLHDYSVNSWRLLFGMGSIPALILFIGMHFVPHSPRWLMQKYGLEKTLKTLKRIRPLGYNFQKEIEEIQSHFKDIPPQTNLLFKQPIINVLAVGIALGIFQQFSGINALMYYGPVIFESAGFYPVSDAILATFCMGGVNFLFTLLTLYYVDKLGRRFLLLSGTLLAALSLFAVVVLFNSGLPNQKFWILGALSIYVMGYCISVGSLFWVLISEIYPLAVRGMAMSIATMVQWGANFVVSISFLTIYQNWGVLTFGLFGTLCLLAFFFIYHFVPETTGASLEKIEKNLWAGKKIRDIGSELPGIKTNDLELVRD
ncbi:sugar porter family MFS transporter [Fluoribacter dumoffii]|uniref:Probable metabolite transport protein CsbC n=1 Tax=Fluoribacter dumoffii TaxID=463 RepID=A0A377GDN4_9GAMM|nr:sugar porter family MFS transporter [Fluoribacter dumoffii]KTC91179.1 sugar-proton symporter [Fluoribacter dumoffii NY 23]MCW8416802.1 sugar porter family MFS transporter [Fluoribacter dumoffii]MCW8455358.1 sugar porter family MFS transporter [Fluoribacter dumoffii]MCW8460564.1 sugar porter family MFS transporter [Fluoribacter dumoffii]MCW8484045.1 sugar porter family MFS transporter [Fluoribacter dumoffii]